MYMPSTGRFNALDEAVGNPENPQSFHKYAYVHNDPIQGIDPLGLEFTLSGQLSVGGIQNNIISGVGYVNKALAAYSRVNKFIELLDYAKLAIRFLRAFQATTPEGAAVALAAAIRERFGGAQAANALLDSFNQALRTIAPDWKNISAAITRNAGKIAAELAPMVASRIPVYAAAQAAGNFRAVFFLPSAPVGPARRHYFNLGGEIQIATSIGGGRLFGFGVQTTPNNDQVQQLYRIDYWDVSRPINRRLHVHYHFPEFDGGDHHPPGRTIWEP